MNALSGSTATAFAPATVGNVACGFDVFGLALEGPGDRVQAVAVDGAGVSIESVVPAPGSPLDIDIARVPTDAATNSAAIAARSLLERHGRGTGVGVALRVEKGLPLAAGLGGSAASAVAAVVAVDAALGLDVPRRELLPHAAAGELHGSGSSGWDNVAPALLGGWLLVRAAAPNDVVELPVPPGLFITLVYPHCEVETARARALLGTKVDLRAATTQWANTAAAVAALHSGDLDLLGRSLVDAVAEPVRASLVPGFLEAKKAALDAGALACSLSGSGPTLFALCEGETRAEAAGVKAAAAFREAGVPATTRLLSPVPSPGARVESRS